MGTKCVIAGGGPAGIMLGYLLAKAGIDTVVLEKWPDFFRDFRGDTIHPSTMQILGELGLIEDFLALPHSELQQMIITIDDKPITLVDFNLLKTPEQFIAFIPQWDFLTWLSNEAKKLPNFRILMESEVTGVCKNGNRVTGVTAQSKGEELTITADLVVGADGRHSTIREQCDFTIKEKGAPIDVLWFRANRPSNENKQSFGFVKEGRILIMLDRTGYWQCAYVINKDALPKIKAEGLDTFKKHIVETSSLTTEDVQAIDSWEQIKLLSVTVDEVEEWAKDGVLLIGDAAHAMSPVGGVGINYAIQDAVAAANILVPAFREGVLSLSVLNKLQQRRSPAVQKMQKIQVFIQKHLLSGSLKQRRNPALLVFRLLRYFPFLRHIPTRTIGLGTLPEHVEIDFGG